MSEQHFAVITASKQTGSGGGLSAHVDREVYDPIKDMMVPYQPKSVIHPERSHLNKEYILKPGQGRTAAIDERIKAAGVTRDIRKDQVKALCFICQSDAEKMKEIEDAGLLDEWVADTLEWFRGYFGRENVVAAKLHMDETTPHLHVTVVPIVQGAAKERKPRPKFDAEGNPVLKKKRRYKKQAVTARLCAAEVMSRSQMKNWQTSYPKAMEKWGMVRGIEGHGGQRVDPAVWNRQQELLKENEELSARNTRLKVENAGLNVVNGAGKAVVAVGEAVAGWAGKSKKDDVIRQLQSVVDGEPERTEAAVKEWRDKCNVQAALNRKGADTIKQLQATIQQLNASVSGLKKRLRAMEMVERAMKDCCKWAAKCARGTAVWQWLYETFNTLCDAKGMNEEWKHGRHAVAGDVWLATVDPDNGGRAHGQFTDEQQEELSTQLHLAAEHPELGRGMSASLRV